jgi:predicted amidohydrolase
MTIESRRSRNVAPFTAVAVQYRIQSDHFSSTSAFQEAMRRLLSSIPRSDSRPTLVVLPEDIGLGLALTGDYDVLRTCATIEEAVHLLLERYAEEVTAQLHQQRRPPLGALLSVLSQQYAVPFYYELFSQLAREFGLYLCAGSAPLPSQVDPGLVQNVSALFGPDGALLGTQAKTQLIPEEGRQGIGMTAGSLDKLTVIELPFACVGIAVCLDAFQPAVLEHLLALGADVILQPSFNPGFWTPEQADEWQTGLWQAVQTYPQIRAGINPMMVGSLFDVYGEGRSSIVTAADRTPDGSGYLARAASATEQEILCADIP